MTATLMSSEMADQPVVLARLVRRAAALIAEVRDTVPDTFTGVSWVARGSSDNAAELGRYLAELSSGRPSGPVAPSLITRYHAELDYRGQLVVGISQSGETPEIVDVCEHLREAGARVLAITNAPESALARVADTTLLTDAGAERAVPATKTVTAQMLLACFVGAGVGSLSIPETGMAALPGTVAEQLEHGDWADQLAASWRDYNGMVVVARGLTYAAALETALKTREVAGIHAEALSVPDLLHGPIAASRKDLPVLLIDSGGRTEHDLDEVQERLVAWNAPTYRCSVGRTLPEILQPIVATVAGQQLARAAALARGLDPDRPAGLSKVTRTH